MVDRFLHCYRRQIPIVSVCTLLVDFFLVKDWFTQSQIQRSPEDFYKTLSPSAYISRDESDRIWPTLLSTPHWNYSLFKLIHITYICLQLLANHLEKFGMNHDAKVRYSCYGKHIAIPPTPPFPGGVIPSLWDYFLGLFFA